MSVINDMLRDLEQRKAPDRSELGAAASSESLIETESPLRKKYLILLALLLLAVGLGVSGLLLRNHTLMSSLVSNSVSNPNQAFSPVSNPEIINQGIASQETVDKPSLYNDVSIATKIALTKKNPVEVAASQREVPPNGSENKKVEVVALQSEATVTRNNFSTIKARAVTNETPDLIEKKSSGSMSIAKAKTNPLVDKPNVLSTKPVVRRKPTVSPEKRDQNMAERSRSLFMADAPRKAYRMLYEFVESHTVDLASRKVLISYLLQDQRIAEAGDVLVTTQVDNSPELRQLKARWYVARGENKLALHTLRERLPELQNYPEYYALLAAYYQRFGFAAKAAETYASLIEFDNESANWWAGLAIALDSSKQYKDAVNAYQQALEIPELSPEVFEYIENRLSLLTVAASR